MWNCRLKLECDSMTIRVGQRWLFLYIASQVLSSDHPPRDYQGLGFFVTSRFLHSCAKPDGHVSGLRGHREYKCLSVPFPLALS